MKTVGPFEFPTTNAEAEIWKPYVRHVALSMRVLCVMQTRIEGTWKAYCDSVRGLNHSIESNLVLSHGEKLPEDIARAIFPECKDVPYAR